MDELEKEGDKARTIYDEVYDDTLMIVTIICQSVICQINVFVVIYCIFID